MLIDELTVEDFCKRTIGQINDFYKSTVLPKYPLLPDEIVSINNTSSNIIRRTTKSELIEKSN